MRFRATEYRSDGEYGVELDAVDWDEARRVCKANDWSISGVFLAVIPASEMFGEAEANALIGTLNEAAESTHH